MAKSNFNKTRRSGKRTPKVTKDSSMGNTRNGNNFYTRDKVDMGSLYKSETNDMSWYNANPELIRDAARIPFTYPLGHTLDLGNTTVNNLSTVVNLPGIISMDIVHGPGVSDSNVSAMNVASRNIYSYVRFANSGHSNYDHQDLMMYLLAMDEAYALLYNAIRAYGCLNSYNPQNRYAPRVLVNALGWDYDKLIKNQAQFRYCINAYIAKLSQMAVPSVMPIFQRHKWLYSGVYADGTSAKAQLYVTRPVLYRTYDETGETGGKLVAHKYPDLMDLDAFYDIIDDVVSPIVGSEDMGIMSGDILKAYGAGRCIRLAAMAEDYAVVPMYDEVVLSQFNNATILEGGTLTLSTCDITQDPTLNAGTLLYTPSFKWPAPFSDTEKAVYDANTIVNLYKNEVTPDDVIEATRLQARVATKPDKTGMSIATCGGDFACGCKIYQMNKDGSYTTYPLSYCQFFVFLGSDLSDDKAKGLIERESMLSQLTKFRYAPPHYQGLINMGASKLSTVSLHWDMDNFSVISMQTLVNMHDACLLSLWDVPNLTTSSRG